MSRLVEAREMNLVNDGTEENMISESLHELFVGELKNLYRTNALLVSVLPMMANAALSPSVRDELKEELDMARGHLDRLERIFESLDENPRSAQDKEMEVILAKGKMTMVHDTPSSSIDRTLVAATQRVVRDAIAGFSCARTYARLLFLDETAQMLQDMLNEEGAADERLRHLAKDGYKIAFNAADARV